MYSFLLFVQKNLSGCIKTISGPERKPNQNLSTQKWNYHSIAAHRFVKVPLLKAYISFYNFDITCLSET